MEAAAKARDTANADSFSRLCGTEPVLEDVVPARDAVPGMKANMILTSGPAMPWSDYTGGQRKAIIGAALFEGLAKTENEADGMLAAGEIAIDGCHAHGCVGSLAGVYSASMPVFVVRNASAGNYAYCNFYEGTNPRRLNYGVYDDGVRDRLLYIQNVVAPVVAEAVRAAKGIALKPIMKRALHMNDELHSRNTAASLLFLREIFPHLIHMARSQEEKVEKAVKAITEDHYFFLRISMAAAKAAADSAHGVKGSSLVTAMAFNCREFAIRVSGLGDRWFTGPHATVEAKLFPGHTQDEITWMGGESTITETVGLGGFAQACAFPLQAYQGGSAEAMVKRNLELYQIVFGEHPDYQIPFLAYRGTPTGIDIFKVHAARILPAMDIGIAGRDGGQIGAGIVRAPLQCFEKAVSAYRQTYQ